MALHRQSGTTGEGVRIPRLSSKADSLAEHVSLAGTLLGGGVIPVLPILQGLLVSGSYRRR